MNRMEKRLRQREIHWQSFDAGMAADHFCLAARAVDLGTLIMGRYDEEKIKEILDLPEEYDVSCIIAVQPSRSHTRCE